MKAVEATKTVTVYTCALCNREHGLKENAENCCACYDCAGPTTAEERATKGLPGGYDYERLCSWCRVRRYVKRAQDWVRSAENRVKDADHALATAKTELEGRQADLAKYVAQREALPPKPRQAKTPEKKTT
jgi:hypothetical protein